MSSKFSSKYHKFYPKILSKCFLQKLTKLGAEKWNGWKTGLEKRLKVIFSEQKFFFKVLLFTWILRHIFPKRYKRTIFEYPSPRDSERNQNNGARVSVARRKYTSARVCERSHRCMVAAVACFPCFTTLYNIHVKPFPCCLYWLTVRKLRLQLLDVQSVNRMRSIAKKKLPNKPTNWKCFVFDFSCIETIAAVNSNFCFVFSLPSRPNLFCSNKNSNVCLNDADSSVSHNSWYNLYTAEIIFFAGIWSAISINRFLFWTNFSHFDLGKFGFSWV